MKITIATDTAADIPQHLLENMNVTLVDLPVTVEDAENPCLSNDEFWKQLLAGKATHTSQPSPDKLKTLFTLPPDETLIYIALSSKLSATYENAVALKNELKADNVYVVDSLNATFGEGMLVQYACELRDRGLDAEQIVGKVSELRKRVRVYACIDTLKYLAHGGRISKSSAAIGTLLNIKPLIEVTNGEVVPYGKTVGHRIAAHKLIERLQKDNIDRNFTPVPIYAYDNHNCLNFVEHANARGFDFNLDLMTPIGSTIGTHIGPYAFGIVFVVSE